MDSAPVDGGSPRPGAAPEASPLAGLSAAARSERLYATLGLVLIASVAVVSALRWSLYPIHVDTYYHMETIEGFRQAGGVVTHAFWEMAPGGDPTLTRPPSTSRVTWLPCWG